MALAVQVASQELLASAPSLEVTVACFGRDVVLAYEAVPQKLLPRE